MTLTWPRGGPEARNEVRRRVGREFLAVALVAAIAVPAAADTRTELDRARRELAEVERRIQADRVSADVIEAELAALNSRLQAAEDRLSRVQAELADAREMLADAEESYSSLRAELNTVASRAYRMGPASTLAILLSPTSPSDLAYRLVILERAGRHEAELVRRAAALRSEWEARRRDLDALLQQEAAARDAIAASKREKEAALARARAVLRDLYQARDRAVALVAQLQTELESEERARLARLFRGPNSIPYGKWAETFLPVISSSTCRNNLVVLVAWQVAEFTRAAWNPLATTYPMPGATDYNSHGVKNYVSLEQGLEATKRTLLLSSHGYEDILAALRRCADPMETARAIRDSDWCRGCADGEYVTGVVPKVEKDYETYANM